MSDSAYKFTLGGLSLLGTLCVAYFLAFQLDRVGPAFSELVLLLTGSVDEIKPMNGDLGELTRYIFALLPFEVTLTFLVGLSVISLLGSHKGKHSHSNGEQPLFTGFFVTMLVEELFARVLFLGFGTKLPLFSGPMGFYLLFLLGNGIWSLIHLMNFERASDRHWLRTVPQFIAGIFFTYMYVKFGFLGALLLHVASNAVLFTLSKKQRLGRTDILIATYSVLVALLAWSSMDRSLVEASALLNPDNRLMIEGWKFWDYARLGIFFSAFMTALAGMLLYDQSSVQRGFSSARNQLTLVGMGFAVGLITVVAVLLSWLVMWLFGFFSSSLPVCAMAAAILFSLSESSRSPSAMSRTFWTTIPSGFVSLAVVYNLGLIAASAYLLIASMVSAPVLIMKQLDD